MEAARRRRAARLDKIKRSLSSSFDPADAIVLVVEGGLTYVIPAVCILSRNLGSSEAGRNLGALAQAPQLAAASQAPRRRYARLDRPMASWFSFVQDSPRELQQILHMLALVAALVSSFAVPPAALVAEFRARDQALLAAVTSGDRSVWDRAMSPDAIYVDEDGNITDKPGLLVQITPLPSGDAGHIAITDYTLHASNDLAIVVHKDSEVEEWHGQTLRANYITTETWRREDGNWKLVLSHVYVVAKSPPAIRVPVAELDGYVGRYQAGPDVIDVVRRDGDHLTIQDRKKRVKPFLVEAHDVLFVPGEPRFRDFFQRDANGRIAGFIQRREGEDVRWTRIP